jgi:hypothetical protein
MSVVLIYAYIYLFICSLFNNAFPVTKTKERRMNESYVNDENGKDLEGSGSGLILRY